MTLSSEERAILHQAQAIKAKGRKQAKAARAKRETPAAGPNPKQPRIHDKPYLAFVRRLPCAASAGEDPCGGPVEAAHVRFSSAASGYRNPGLQAKQNDRRTLPLCVAHHRGGRDSQHAGNERKFWSLRGIDPDKLCLALNECFDNGGEGGVDIVRRFAGEGSNAHPR